MMPCIWIGLAYLRQSCKHNKACEHERKDRGTIDVAERPWYRGDWPNLRKTEALVKLSSHLNICRTERQTTRASHPRTPKPASRYIILMATVSQFSPLDTSSPRPSTSLLIKACTFGKHKIKLWVTVSMSFLGTQQDLEAFSILAFGLDKCAASITRHFCV